MTGRVLGSNVITGSYGYFLWNTPNGAGRLSSANYTGSVALQTRAYTYDAAGNIKTLTDALTSELQSFNYDALDRLTSATVTGGPAPYSESYGYNATTGNPSTGSGQVSLPRAA